MRRRHQRLMRFFRLVAACIAFVVVRPAPCAAATVAHVVLVADTSPRAAVAEDDARLDTASCEPSAGVLASRAVALLPPPCHFRSAPRFGGAAPRLYLRNCALLR